MRKVEMRLLNTDKRINTFEEVSLGYNKEEALMEASRCLDCINAKCIKGCPVEIDIPSFIRNIDNLDKAYSIIANQNYFPGICGRVCPQEKQCESLCIRNKIDESVAIGRLERYVSDNALKKELKIISDSNLNVGVVGSGPSSLAFASTSLSYGSKVTVYEALNILGGVLSYGIPEFRLPRNIINDEIELLKKAGAIFKTNCVVGLTKTVEELLDVHDYLFIGTGAGTPKFLNIKNEEANNVLSANEFLTRVNLMKAHEDNKDTPLPKFKNAIIIGGGNVAMDASRVAKRILGESKDTSVSIVYRRNIDSMPARYEEVHHALEEGIVINEYLSPFEVIVNSKKFVTGLKCYKTCQVIENGIKIVKNTDEEVTIECDLVVIAIGNNPNPILKNTTNLFEFEKNGLIKVDQNFKSTHNRIYAGGDITTGSATVILAMEAGKKASLDIHKKKDINK